MRRREEIKICENHSEYMEVLHRYRGLFVGALTVLVIIGLGLGALVGWGLYKLIGALL